MPKNDLEFIDDIKVTVDSIYQEFDKVVVGQHDILEKILVSIFANGHSLLVGVPGLAKTLIVNTLAEILGLSFNRIQFTPDLMPSDITGTELLDIDDKGHREYKFIKGPIFTNILLGDEINRTPPKTQAALLEAMQERKLTVSGKDYVLDSPFLVLATQNPLEQEGTYPLPEAQLDRFMFFLYLDYPSKEDEINIVKKTTIGNIEKINDLKLKDKLIDIQKFIQKLDVENNVIEYAVDIVRETRNESEFKDVIRYGAGPRASQYLVLAAKALAVIRGDLLAERSHVDEIVDIVLRHRVALSFTGEADGWTHKKLFDEIINKVK